MMNKEITKPDLGIERGREDDLNDYVVDRLILMEMLTCLQKNIMQEVVDELRREGKFRFSLKNTLNNIKRELKEILGDFFHKIDTEGTSQFVESFEILENNVYVIAGLKSIDDVFDKNKPTLLSMFNKEWFAEHSLPPKTEDIIEWTLRNTKYHDRYIK